MNNRLLIALVFALLWLPATAAEWNAEQGQWYVLPMIGATVEDKGRDADPGIAGSLTLGRQLTENWGVELSVFGSKHGGFNKLAQIGWELDLVGFLNTGGLVSPYVVIGGGFMQTDVVEHPIIPVELDATDGFGSIGVGLLAPLGNNPTRLRAELRTRTDFGDTEFVDTVIQIGLYRPIGQRAAPRPRLLASAPDADGDGVADDIDQCSGTPAGTVVDQNGCEADSDSDGVRDSVDRCPGTPRGVRVDATGCKPATDSDGDGVVDRDDRCPGTPGSVRVGRDGCELDSDNDGVVDSLDRCPGSQAGVRIDVHGCEIREKIELPGVAFELNSAALRPESASVLEQAVATLQRNPNLRVEAAGHTDTTGSDQFNLNLSQARAERVRQYLVDRGIDPNRVTARGYGEGNPIADNSTREGRIRNRRVELRVLN